jgi:hypothetical protein
MLSPVIHLLFGVFVGFLVQLTAVRRRHNGEWDKIKFGKKVAMAATGGICSITMGLAVLANMNGDIGEKTLYTMWLYQIVAAWMGAELLDVASNGLKGFVKRFFGKGEP